jgi:predicted nucleotidyltransferase
MVDEDTQLNPLIQRIVELVHPLEIILFGSRARGDASPDSDIDLLVVMPEGTHRRNTARYLYQYLSRRTIPLDLIVATTGDLAKHRNNIGLIYYYILKEGKSLYVA